jgi:hypothetical protein
MRWRRRTLVPMDLALLDRILAFVCDVIDANAGDWDATERALRREFTDPDELDQAFAYAMAYLIAYAEPGGPEFIRQMRDRRRRLVPAQPAGAPGRWGRRVRWPA